MLTGARQTGKTTLSKNCFPGYSYLSIEDPILRTQYKALTAGQWKASYPRAILDEVQREPQLIESIKSVYDQYEDPRYLLLGSSQLLLLEKVRESLAGRCIIMEVYPLTLPEMLTDSWDEPVRNSLFQNFILGQPFPDFLPSFKLYEHFAKTEQWFNYYLHFGGYPAIVDDHLTNEQRREWLENYIRTYLERDIRDLADFKSLEPFVKTQKISSMLTGQLMNYTSLAKEAGISSRTAQRFIHYLEISYQTITLQPWFKNSLKRLNKSPKLHYLDPGIQRVILQKQGELTGSEYESAVIAELYKQLKNISFRGSLYHLRTSDGREVDLLIELENGYIAIEVKQSGKVDKTDARHLLNLGELLDKPLLKGFVLSNDHTIATIHPNIMAVPSALFLAPL